MSRFQCYLILFLIVLISTINITFFLKIWHSSDEQNFRQKPAEIKSLDASSFWCDGLRIDGDGNFDVFYIVGDSDKLKRHIAFSTKTMVFHVDHGNYTIARFYLRKDSLLNILACSSERNTSVAVLTNRSDASECFVGDSCPSSILSVVPLESKFCFLKDYFRYMDAAKLAVPLAGNYYVLICNYGGSSADLTIKFDLFAFSYDVTSAKRNCIAKTLCKFQIDFMETGKVIIESKSETILTMTVQCRLNITLIVLIFFVAPIVLLLLIICTIYHFGGDNKCLHWKRYRNCRTKKVTFRETVDEIYRPLTASTESSASDGNTKYGSIGGTGDVTTPSTVKRIFCHRFSPLKTDMCNESSKTKFFPVSSTSEIHGCNVFTSIYSNF